MSFRIRKTRFKELGYARISNGHWQCLDITDETPAQVGPIYPTEKTLLADFDRYARESWGLGGVSEEGTTLPGRVSPKEIEEIVKQRRLEREEMVRYLRDNDTLLFHGIPCCTSCGSMILTPPGRPMETGLCFFCRNGLEWDRDQEVRDDIQRRIWMAQKAKLGGADETERKN